MKIEFRKLPLVPSEFEITSDSVKFLGNFSKISTNIAKIDATIEGDLLVDCCRCGEEMLVKLNEKVELLLSDGIYKQKDEDDLVVIEIDNHTVDFDELLQSELESLRSEFYTCSKCNDDEDLEVEY
jgi:uncharacterized metal-binding protein YceD (DUF177 family)